ncbi:ABC transporter permease subunit [Embleya sp. NBC_00896]|uniref:ABC transporter permease n=1 Tax=Embleya sp. NBC_00896 TaxID=2975961 RepID=UPI002F910FB5|nr:ABC transporter permease subunit [Embleya sp. NBC_00896]
MVGRYALAVLLIAVPLLLALLGPFVAGPAEPRAVSFTAGDGHPLGTDFAGRDVWREVLFGGRSVVLVALAATVLTYAVALPLGLGAALTRRAWVEEALMRPLDVLLAVPSLLLVLLVAALLAPGPGGLTVVVAVAAVPDATRVVHATAVEIAARPAVEALRMQGESWWRTAVGYVARSMRRVLAADAGIRLTGALYLVATAAFLGVGVQPDVSDWAVMVDRNRPGLFLQPWAVVVPAALIVALSMGTNLLFDAALQRSGHAEETRDGSPGESRGESRGEAPDECRNLCREDTQEETREETREVKEGIR